jgi:AraC family transcriptional regulator
MAVRFWQVDIMRQRTKASYAIRIERVLAEIVARMDEPLRLNDLAGVAGVSPFHFHRVFQAMVGETVGEVVRRMRLTRAGLRLRTSRDPVTEIALEAGYGSVEGFGRAFRSAYSMAPSAYRAALPPTPLRPSNLRIDYRPDTNHVRFIHIPGDHGMDVTIETFPCEPAVLLRHVGPYENVVDAYKRMFSWIGVSGMLGPDTKILGLSYDNPEQVAAEQLRYDVCFTTPALVTETPDDIRTEMLPGGRYAVYIHKGSYAGFSDAFQRLFCLWLPESGEELADRPCVEWYLNDPMDTPESELLTKLCIPLQGELE